MNQNVTICFIKHPLLWVIDEELVQLFEFLPPCSSLITTHLQMEQQRADGHLYNYHFMFLFQPDLVRERHFNPSSTV